MTEVTSREIMQAAGIGDVVTLTRWHKQGLIPPPVVKTHPEGRGKMAYWPAWVLHRCFRIKQLRKEGKRLAEIKDFLGTDWEEESRRYNRAYRYAEVSRQLDQDAALMNLRATIEDRLQEWMAGQRKRLAKTTVAFIARDLVEQALPMLEAGINPVLVVDDEATQLTADFAVGDYLARHTSVENAVMVVPIFKELSAYLRGQADIPDKPSMLPSTTVIDKSRKRQRELSFVVMDDWSVELERPKSRRRRKKRQ